MQLLIVEDHQLLAQSLAAALRVEGLKVRITAGPTGDDVLEAARAEPPDLVLLDLDLGAIGSSVPLVEPLAGTGAKVVILTGSTNRRHHAEAVEAGAVGLLDKSLSFDALLAAVRGSVDGRTLLSPNERHDLLAELRRTRTDEAQRRGIFDKLTPREQQVLAALMDGKSAEAIAEDWVVSLATVRSQIRSLLLKLGVNSQLAAVAAARRAAWRLAES